MSKLFLVLFGSVWIVLSIIMFLAFDNAVDTSAWPPVTEAIVTDLFPIAMALGGLFFIISGGTSIRRNRNDYYK